MAIYLSAGHHLKDSGAVGVNNRQENRETIKLRDAILNFIRPEYKVFTDNDNETLSQYLNRIKPGNGSVVLECHFDAATGTATGTTALYRDGADKNTIAMGEELTNFVSRTLGIKNRGVISERQSHRGTLALTHEPGITILLEIAFIDNGADMAKYDSHFMQIAQGIAKILMKYDDLIK